MLPCSCGIWPATFGILALAILPALTPVSATEGAVPEVLSPAHQTWLVQVAPLITEAERQAFANLHREYQRDAFIDRFWEARNGFLPTWERRLLLADELFGDLDTDRARTLLLIGAPELMLGDLCPELARPLEAWFYGKSTAFDKGFYLVFVPDPGGDEPTMVHWQAAGGVESLFLPTSLEAQDLETLLSQLYRRCGHGKEMADVAQKFVTWRDLQEENSLFPPEPANWLGTLEDWTGDLGATTASLTPMLDIEFPGRHQQKTVTQIELTLPVDAATPSDSGGAYNLRLDGELLRQNHLYDRFRYRFDLPVTAITGRSLPLVFQRYLLPGEYLLILRLEDLNSHHAWGSEDPIVVPPPESAAAEPETPLAEANSVLVATDSWIRIEPLAEQLLTGKVRVQAETRGADIAKVTFVLDNRPVMSKTRPPYGVEIDLGQAPRLHTLEAVAFDAAGLELARDLVPVNAGPHRFGVRLLEPRAGQRYIQSLRAAAEVDLPAGETVERVDFYLNETRLASLFQPPFAQPILLPENQRITYVRAVAFLQDGNSTEDLVFINAPRDMGQLNINMVELYTTVNDKKGRPIEGLTRTDFVIREEGQPHEIRRFELVRDLSIHAGVVIDASTSMREELDEAIDSALSFFETVIQPKDRAAAVVFNDEPTLRVPFTNDIDVLTAGLGEVRSEGETALYDTLAYTIHYFSGIRGKRALILLSDGEDSRSRFSLAETLEFAQRSGVAIYSIALGLDRRRIENRNVMMRLASETGGRFFSIASAKELDETYAAIEQELRTQYLLVYQSQHEEGGDFRRVEVAVDGLKVRTIPGYYP